LRKRHVGDHVFGNVGRRTYAASFGQETQVPAGSDSGRRDTASVSADRDATNRCAAWIAASGAHRRVEPQAVALDLPDAAGIPSHQVRMPSFSGFRQRRARIAGGHLPTVTEARKTFATNANSEEAAREMRAVSAMP
jgi:hypothetical protein